MNLEQSNSPFRTKYHGKNDAPRRAAAGDHSEQDTPPEKKTIRNRPAPMKKLKAPRPPKPVRLSGVDAAAEVLKQAGGPMQCQALADAVVARGWRTAGKTPAKTLHAVLSREIAGGTEGSRFRKAGPGLFEYVGG